MINSLIKYSWTIFFLLLTHTLTHTTLTQQGITIRFPDSTPTTHCYDTLDADQLRQQNITYASNLQQLQWIDINCTHMVRAIIEFVNHKPTNLLKIINDTVQYTLQYCADLIVMSVIFGVLTIWWFWKIFQPVQKYTQAKEERSKSDSWVDKNSIGITICLFSVGAVCFLCFQGIRDAPQIRKTINSVTCALTRQNNIGFIKDPIQTANLQGGPLQLALQIKMFQQRAKEHLKEVQPLFKNQKLATLARKSEAMVHAWGSFARGSMFMKDLNQTATQLKHVSTVIRDLPNKVRIFNDTIEEVRQIMYGFKLVIGNFDKFISRYIGFDSLSNFFPRLTVLSLALIALLSIGSIAVIIWVSLTSRHNQAHLRQGGQYLLGVCFILCLVVALAMSVFIPSLSAHKDYLNYLVATPQNMKSQFRFKNNRYINRFMFEIITHFFSNAQGSISHYFDGKLLSELEYLQHAFITINSEHFALLQVEAQAYFGEENKSQAAELAQLGKILDQNLESQVRIAEKAVRQLIFEMKDASGSLGRIETRSLGLNTIYPLLNHIRINIFNRLCEYRYIYGWCSFAILLCLISTSLIGEVSSNYFQIDDQTDKEQISTALPIDQD